MFAKFELNGIHENAVFVEEDESMANIQKYFAVVEEGRENGLLLLVIDQRDIG